MAWALGLASVLTLPGPPMGPGIGSVVWPRAGPWEEAGDTVLCGVREGPRVTAGGWSQGQAWGLQAQVCLPPGAGGVCAARGLGRAGRGAQRRELLQAQLLFLGPQRSGEAGSAPHPALSLPSQALSVTRDNLADPGSPTSRLTTAEGCGLPETLHPLDVEAGRNLSSCGLFRLTFV